MIKQILKSQIYKLKISQIIIKTEKNNEIYRKLKGEKNVP